MTRRRAAAVLAAFLLLTSMGAPEPASWTGKLAAKGTEPLVFLALVDREGRQWRLAGPVVKDLWPNQGRWVRVTGQAQGRDGILVETWARVPDEETKP
jgi:hypothetical protein